MRWTLVLSADVENSVDIVREARKNNPGIRILARCPHLRDAAVLRQAGASVIAAGEAEVAVALAEAVISDQATQPEDMARQRAGIRSELYQPGILHIDEAGTPGALAPAADRHHD